MTETMIDNALWAAAAPRLSVLIPFYRDDPTALVKTLGRQGAGSTGQVEIVALSDGGGDAALNAAAHNAVTALPAPARLIILAANIGRARGRNRLAAHARADTFLFLDSDMAPDGPDFLDRYLALIAERAPAVAFGGFSMAQVKAAPPYRLHKALSEGSECLPAADRARAPEKYVYTSNLLVRRDVFASEAFDEGFAGWGWEDVEWGMRVARRYGVIHIDNPATHLGLDTPQALAAKYEQSAGNFARVAARHPEVVSRYPTYRLARLLKRLPLIRRWRGALKWAAIHGPAPIAARVMALKAYRAALYAEVV